MVTLEIVTKTQCPVHLALTTLTSAAEATAQNHRTLANEREAGASADSTSGADSCARTPRHPRPPIGPPLRLANQAVTSRSGVAMERSGERRAKASR